MNVFYSDKFLCLGSTYKFERHRTGAPWFKVVIIEPLPTTLKFEKMLTTYAPCKQEVYEIAEVAIHFTGSRHPIYDKVIRVKPLQDIKPLKIIPLCRLWWIE